MGNDELQVRVVVQYPAKNQVMDGDGRVERVADHIDQVVVGKAPRLRKASRMHEDQHAEFFDPREDLAEALGGKVLAGDVGGDLDAAELQ
jgi:hypothetical protein